MWSDTANRLMTALDDFLSGFIGCHLFFRLLITPTRKNGCKYGAY